MNTKITFKSIQENNKKLDKCPKHNFGDCPPVKVGFGKNRLECKNCHGVMSLLDIDKYIKGYVAHGGNPDDILNGYYVD